MRCFVSGVFGAGRTFDVSRLVQHLKSVGTVCIAMGTRA